MTENDPYRHHPELRGEIKPAADSFFRDLDLDALDAHMVKAGFPSDWRTPNEDREAKRCDWLKERWGRDLWVFGYGSLMWDPSVEYVEVRRAHCPEYQRSFCLWDDGARGSVNEPGLMLAIDEGGSCEGVAFRIEADKVDYETFVLFRREMIMPAYRPTWLNLDTAAGPIEALGFVADREAENIRPGIPFQTQAKMISQAEGLLGTNYEYLSDTEHHLKLLGIEDPYIVELCEAVGALCSASA